jgi:hypothetical protein
VEEQCHGLSLIAHCLLLAIALAVRIPLILLQRAVFGGDSVLRIARSDELLVGYWLPLPQLLVMAARALHPDPLWTRIAFALVGALAAVALARAVAAVHGTLAGLCAGALLALHPLWAYYSLVPYQEGLTLLFLLLGAEALVRGRERMGAVWLGLACLCRYEAWIAAGMAAAVRWRRPARAVAFLAVPLLWTLAHLGLGPRGSYVLDLDPAARSFSRLAFLLLKLREYSGAALLVLAVAGLWAALRRRDRRWEWGAAYVAAVVMAAALAGHETPPGSGRISERMAHIPAAALCASAGLALAAAVEAARGRARVPAQAAAAVLIAVLGWRWHAQLRAQVREAASDPSLRLAVQVAALAERELPAGARLAVFGRPMPAQAVQAYVNKVEASGGDVEAARANAARLSQRSPDVDLVAAQLARPPQAVTASGGAAALLAVFDDAAEPAACGEVRGRFVAAPRAVTVCRPAR